ncbi:MAG: hypothetical protein ACRC2O_06915 [Chitinophagaceae bacterium]
MPEGIGMGLMGMRISDHGIALCIAHIIGIIHYILTAITDITPENFFIRSVAQ